MRKIEIYADGADLGTIARLAAEDWIAGFTTNPALMRKAGITDYRAFAHEVLRVARGKPVSFEVLADEQDQMAYQALDLSRLGPNVYVKVPITNSRGESCCPLIAKLGSPGVRLNVTAVLSKGQVRDAIDALGRQGIVSIFAGRIADTGRDPVRVMNSARSQIRFRHAGVKVLWASARQVYDVVLAEGAGCDIITLPPELIAKLPMLGRNLEEYSLDTVRQFYKDAEGITL